VFTPVGGGGGGGLRWAAVKQGGEVPVGSGIDRGLGGFSWVHGSDFLKVGAAIDLG